MKNLLDTHTILWFLNGERLTANAKEKIQSHPNYISVVSLWEVAIKMNIGKYTFEGGFTTFLKLIKDNGFELLPINDNYMECLFDLPLIHRDPFDRLIVATALVEGMTLITADENIQKYDISWAW